MYLSLTASPPDLGVPAAFDAGHVLAYCWLMFWFAQIHHAQATRRIYAVAFIALGMVLEFIQGYGGYRQFEYSDMLLNTLGVALGWGLASTRLQYTLHGLERVMARA